MPEAAAGGSRAGARPPARLPPRALRACRHRLYEQGQGPHGGCEEARIDKEHGMVVVLSNDGGCLSDSDSDDSDWSIG